MYISCAPLIEFKSYMMASKNNGKRYNFEIYTRSRVLGGQTFRRGL
jgi:hypothetical protein